MCSFLVDGKRARALQLCFVTIIIISMTTISCHLSHSLAPQLQGVADFLVVALLGAAGAIATAVQAPHRATGAAAAAAMEAVARQLFALCIHDTKAVLLPNTFRQAAPQHEDSLRQFLLMLNHTRHWDH